MATASLFCEIISLAYLTRIKTSAIGPLRSCASADWLQRLGAHSLIIYLAFVLPMGIARTLLLSLDIEEPNLLSLVIMAAAITAPLFLWWITKKAWHWQVPV